MHPDAYCQEKAAPGGSAAYYAFLFLDPPRKRALTALAALCRALDTIVRDSRELSVARMKLAWWHTQIDQMQAGTADHPVTQALMPHMTAFGLPVSSFHTLIKGREMALDQLRYTHPDDLHRVCRATSGVAAELAATICGYTDPATLVYAQKMGLALRLSQLLRRVGDDARHNRIYLPQADLHRFGVRPADILHTQHSPQFVQLMQHQAQQVRLLMRAALQALPPVDRRAQRPGLILLAIHHTLLRELEREHWQVLQQQFSLTPIRKFYLAWKTQVTGGRSVLRALRRV